MGATASSAESNSLYCAVCREVYKSPRLLHCHHSFCLKCLHDLANKQGSVIRCPTCKAPTKLPAGGVGDLQMNFYLSEEKLENERRVKGHETCPVHENEHVTLYCAECDQVMCIRCKVTKHDGHLAEDIASTVLRCKKQIENDLRYLDDCIKRTTEKAEIFQSNEKKAQEKKEALAKQIQARYDKVVTLAGFHRDQALRELDEISDNLEQDLAADTRRIQDAVNSLKQFRARACQTLSSAYSTEVLQLKKEMSREGENIELLKRMEDELPNTTSRPVLHGDYNNKIEQYIQKFIGFPVILTFPSQEKINMFCIVRCGDKECFEVRAVREKEDRCVDVFYGGPRESWQREKMLTIMPDGKKVKEVEMGRKSSFITRKGFAMLATSPEKRFGSKGESTFLICQSCRTGDCSILPVKIVSDDGREKCLSGDVFMRPKVNKVHNFDANKSGELFCVIDEKNNSDDDKKQTTRDVESNDQMATRFVSVFIRGQDESVMIYTPPNQQFFPTDVCFCNDGRLLIADWMNDCVHVATLDSDVCNFVRYLPGSGDIVRPTALNLDLDGNLLIGCGDGQVLRCSISG